MGGLEEAHVRGSRRGNETVVLGGDCTSSALSRGVYRQVWAVVAGQARVHLPAGREVDIGDQDYGQEGKKSRAVTSSYESLAKDVRRQRVEWLRCDWSISPSV